MPNQEPMAFRTRAEFRRWLQRHHARAQELVVRLFKVHASGRGIGYKEALDEALCFGWIDGVRRAYDEDSYTQRFTPRKPRSTWSRVNVAHVQRLITEGRMAPPGLASFEAREEARTGVYSFERRTELTSEYQERFEAHARAWTYFCERPPWYRRTCAHWVMSAKREETRAARLSTLIECSAHGKPIPALARMPAKKV